jgi:4-carboxymuconolactone decarboxylase
LGARRAQPPRPQPRHPWHLIALRANDELRVHLQIARNNGLTDDEITEVIHTACRIARDVLDETS